MKLFLPEQIKPYLNWIARLLYPYRDDFSRPILNNATNQLLADYKQYQFIQNERPINPNDKYYFALFDNRNRYQYFYRAWAAVYVLYSMHSCGMQLRPSDEEIFAQKALRNYLYDFLENASKDETVCPQCFLDAFCIDVIQRRVDTSSLYC
jgi:hypothetical protein